MNGQTTVTFLRGVLLAYPTQPILLLWDRAKWHKGQAVRLLLAEIPRLQTVFFPPASPHLNPQEHVWAQARDEVRHNHNCPPFHISRQRFSAFYPHITFTLIGWLSMHLLYCLFPNSDVHQIATD